MKKKIFFYIPGIIIISAIIVACNAGKNKHPDQFPGRNQLMTFNQKSKLPFDSNLLYVFYNDFPELNKYKSEVATVYRQHNYMQIWYDKDGVIEIGYNLISKARELQLEGLGSQFPYQDRMDDFFDNEQKNKLSQLETELMLTNIYFYYTEHVYKGLGDSTSKAIGWLLPRKQVSYARLLDSVLSGPSMITNDENVLFSQYYKLRDVLRRYQDIEIRRAWHTTEQDSNLNNQTVFIRKMEMPIGDRIKKIIVNMERCRWISAGLDKAPVYIFVNIPSFKLNLYRNGKSELESAVIVGADLTKTVIFSGMMNQIVFNPYWYLPKSIIEEEVKPGIEKNKHYLKLHRMEWHDGQLRQLPGKNNSLGLIKFLFPNSNDIYIHDTPAKSLFAKQSRALSHGCIRVETPAALAMAVLKGDSEWTPERIEAAMNAGEESSYMLKNKIPVIIGYLTAWVDEKGDIHFFKDIYDRDDRLARLLIEDE